MRAVCNVNAQCISFFSEICELAKFQSKTSQTCNYSTDAKKTRGAVERLGLKGSVFLDTEHLSNHWYYVEEITAKFLKEIQYIV